MRSCTSGLEEECQHLPYAGPITNINVVYEIQLFLESLDEEVNSGHLEYLKILKSPYLGLFISVVSHHETQQKSGHDYITKTEH